MATTSEQPPHRRRRSPARLLVSPIRASRGLSRATVKLIRSIGRIQVPTSQQTRAIGKGGPERLRKLRNRSVAAIRQSITITGGLPARTVRKVKRPAGHDRDLAGAIRANAATRAPVDRGHTAPSPAKAAVPSTGRTAERRRKAGERAAPIQQDQVEAKPATPRAETRRARQRRATSHQAKPEQAKRTQDLEQHTARELREQARKAGIEGSSSMTKGQLMEALQPSATGSQTQTGPYEERTVKELQERAAKLGIKGRSSMTKEQLIKALRDHR